jgi:hypothetical protein
MCLPLPISTARFLNGSLSLKGSDTMTVVRRIQPWCVSGQESYSHVISDSRHETAAQLPNNLSRSNPQTSKAFCSTNTNTYAITRICGHYFPTAYASRSITEISHYHHLITVNPLGSTHQLILRSTPLDHCRSPQHQRSWHCRLASLSSRLNPTSAEHPTSSISHTRTSLQIKISWPPYRGPHFAE